MKKYSDKRLAIIRRNYAIKKAVKEKHISAPYPHFRYYKKSAHPTLIVGEQSDNEYKFRKVMHGDKDGGRTNEMVYPNPNPKDKEPMYIGKRVRHDKKNAFNNTPLPWKYPKKDK